MATLINYRSNIEEINSTASSILNTVSAYNYSEDNYLVEIINTLSGFNFKMTEAFKEEIVRSTLAPLDEIRDKSARVIFLEVKSKLLWPDKNIVEAAQRISQILDKYGMEVLNMSYGAESTNINSMLNELNKTSLAPTRELLHGFDTLIVQLEKDQKIFEAAFQEYISKKAERSKILSAGKLGELVKNQVNNDLMKYLDVMVKVKPDLYEECAQKIETIIKENNTKVKARVNKLREKADLESKLG